MKKREGCNLTVKLKYRKQNLVYTQLNVGRPFPEAGLCGCGLKAGPAGA